ncbi:EAL domain-containing protein [Anaerocolumna sedimenticola]|uniref:EAL domain-containing protein n=1 Tax=Anaerocolumna sedimenticola TaxID=2696063 RepID=A0A6P1TNQ7_9FIRM|nr:EAL domain-containing protein [Anaerocolumna sedimenticola]QHQ61521.1 EAL domain-containing protein [Anaerocolumna sedimenticola]
MFEKLDILASKLANQQTIRALRKGLIYMMPLILIGSIILALINLPIPAYQEFLIRLFGEGWKEIGLSIHKSTLKIMAILTLITVSYAIAREKKLVKSGEVNSIIIVITAFSSFFAFKDNTELILSEKAAGSGGMFEAIIISILACKLFCFLYQCCDRVLPSNLMDYNGSAQIRASFRAIIPGMFTILFFCVARELFELIGLNAIKAMLLQDLYKNWLTGHNYSSSVIILLLTHILWFFGIHGGNVVIDALSEATPVVNSGAAITILTKEFFDTYVYLGGAGATLGLLVALLLCGIKSGGNKWLKASLFPTIFNINEFMIYGLPIIFNPYYLIPFLLSPIVLSLTAWVSVRMEWVPPITQEVAWTTPIFLSGYLSTGSVAGIVLQAVNLVLAVLIYIPFVRLQKGSHQQTCFTVFANLVNEINYIQERQQNTILNRHDETGVLARELMNEMKHGLMNDCVPMHLEYQPKVNYKGEVMGAEALLRWNHPIYGNVSPLIILRICDEANLTNELGRWVMKQAFRDFEHWSQQKCDKICLSVNLSPRQLQEDATLVQYIKSCIELFHIDPGFMELELTENATIDLSASTQNKLKQIREFGMNLSIDDFGMGHSSLLYLCNLYTNVVKIDASLIHNVSKDGYYGLIIKSILSLCDQLNVKVIAEGVETKEQVEILHELGCRYFQGFYFSKSLTSDKFLEYVMENGCIQKQE